MLVLAPQQESLEHDGHTIFLVRRSDFLCRGEHCRMSIRYSYRASRPPEQRQVVRRIAEGYDLVRADSKVDAQRF